MLTKKMAIKMYKEGHTPTAIARAYNMSPHIIHQWLKETKKEGKKS